MFIFLLRWAESVPAEVEDVSGRTYLKSVIGEIQHARASIYGVFYIIRLNKNQGPVFDILRELVKAKQRNVKVEIVLNRGTDSSFDSTSQNSRAFSFLKKNGISVFYDDTRVLTHSKYWIFDETTVIASSTNLSEASILRNREAGFLVRSREMAAEYLMKFQEIPRFSPEPVKGAIPVPKSFFMDRKLRPEIDPNSCLWSFCLRVYKKSYEDKTKVVVFTPKDAEDFFSYPEPYDKAKHGGMSADKYLRQQLYHWRERHKGLFISAKWDSITRTNTVILRDQNEAMEDSLYVDEMFFQDRWDMRLSSRGIFAYLYVLDRTDSGRSGKYFEQFQKSAHKEYGITVRVLGNGLTDLQRYNLIEKYYSQNMQDSLEPNGIQLNPFYIMKDFSDKLEDLRSKTPGDLMAVALAIADRINEPHDLNVIRELLVLGTKFGAARLKEALKRIPKTKVSRYRQWPYLRQVIISGG
ncbi:MAG: hypothetical protein JW774_04325 [Candidatus Aureabacteria bacterium]|nr:hypothetical protein [Candidatus Auribacterota bacterium]